MITFSQFLLEALDSSRLKSVSKKETMRGVISRSFKADMPEMQKYFGSASSRSIKSKYNAFLLAWPEQAAKIESMRPEGVGPGEMLAYFIFDDITLGGGSSHIDLFKDGEEFAEVKAGDGSGDRVSDFKLDTEHSKSADQLFKNLGHFNEEYRRLTGNDLPNWRGAGEASSTALQNWRHVNLVDLGAGTDEPDLEHIEKDWVGAIKDAYIKDKYFMLVNRKNMRVNYFGQLGVEMVQLLRTTRGQPKAAVSP